MAPKRGKQSKLPPFVGMPWHLLNSQAYRELPPSAAKALPFFLGKPHIPYSNAQIFEVSFDFSYREARRRIKLGNSTFAKVIRALIGLGFIDPRDKGGLKGDGHSTSKFKVSKRWEAYGTEAFEEVSWEQFQPPRK